MHERLAFVADWRGYIRPWIETFVAAALCGRPFFSVAP
jgi:hypothetical protein